MMPQIRPIQPKTSLFLLLLAILGLLLACNLARGGDSSLQEAEINFSPTQTALAEAFATDLVVGQTAIAIANATAIAANETATAQAILQTPPAEYAVVEVAPAPTANAASPPEFTPTPLPTATVSPVEMPTPLQVEVPAGVEQTAEDKPAQLEVDYRERMLPGEQSNVNAFIYFLPPVVSQNGFVAVPSYPSYQPPIVNPIKEKSPILARPQMELKLSSPGNAFAIYPEPGPSLKSIPSNVRALWTWTIEAPDTPNTYNLRLDLFHADGSWSDARYMIVKVEAATPVSTRSNLFDSSVVVALISAAGTIFAALITGLISFFVARDSFPIIGTKAGYKRTLRTLYSNLAQLEHRAAQHGPLDVPLKLQNEIDATKQQIAEVEAKLVELESQ